MSMNDPNRTFGLPSVPRNTMPSMFQILGWFSDQQAPSHPLPSTQNQVLQVQNTADPEQNIAERQNIQNQLTLQSENQQQVKRDRRHTSMTRSGVYEYQQACLKRSASHQKCQTTNSKIVLNKKLEPIKKFLDPNNVADAKEIQERKKRIKKFQYVTRDLSNSAFTTYYGKPAWEAYGRCNSNPKHLTHNVMPHRGDNHPKQTQSYYSALIKAKNKALSTYVPRKPIQQARPDPLPEEQPQPINLPVKVPDLVNHIRFAPDVSRKNKDYKIPTNKVAPLKAKKAKREEKKERKKRPTSQGKVKEDDGLKYMNNRQHLLQILENKRTNKSKLAWKVTECYPFDLNNEQDLKKSTLYWEKVPSAGVQTRKGDTMKDLMEVARKEREQ